MEVMECYGCLDVLILNSSLKVKAPAHCVSLETDKLLMDNNYFGPVTLAKGDSRIHYVVLEYRIRSSRNMLCCVQCRSLTC